MTFLGLVVSFIESEKNNRWIYFFSIIFLFFMIGGGWLSYRFENKNNKELEEKANIIVGYATGSVFEDKDSNKLNVENFKNIINEYFRGQKNKFENYNSLLVNIIKLDYHMNYMI